MVVNRITTMGGRAGGGSRGGGGGSRSWDGSTNRTAFGRVGSAMINAYENGNAADRAAARKQMEAIVKKMPTAILSKYAASASDAAWLTRKGSGPASEYSRPRHEYNFALSKIYNKELAKRK